MCQLHNTLSVCTYLHVSSHNNTLQFTVFTSLQFLLTSIKLSTEVSAGTLPDVIELSIGISSKLMQWGLSRIAWGPVGCATGCALLSYLLSPKSVQNSTSLHRILTPSLQNMPDQSPYQSVTVYTPRNLHAGENVHLQNAGYKQTASYLSLKVSFKKNRRLHKKENVVSDVCRMKQCTGQSIKKPNFFFNLLLYLQLNQIPCHTQSTPLHS